MPRSRAGQERAPLQQTVQRGVRQVLMLQWEQGRPGAALWQTWRSTLLYEYSWPIPPRTAILSLPLSAAC